MIERPRHDRRARRVVLVDDDPAIRSVVRSRLSLHGGFAVVGEAGSAGAALKLAWALAPELVVLDLEMPGMNGAEVIPQLRQIVPGVRVVMFSSASRGRIDEMVSDSPPDAIVAKGGSLSVLVGTLSEVLARTTFAVGSWPVGPLAVDTVGTDALRHATDAQRVIDEAKGVLIVDGRTSEEAMIDLRRRADQTSRTLLEVATRVLNRAATVSRS